MGTGSAFTPASETNFPTVTGVVPIGEELLFIVRRESFPYMVQGHDQDFPSDIIVDASWREVPNSSGLNFLAKQWMVTDNAGYICTQDGSIFRVTPQSVTKIDAPGECETIVQTTSRTPLASFRGEGIYKYREGWRLRAAHPDTFGAGEYWTRLSENGPEIAMVMDGQPLVWVYRDSEFHVIKFP